MKHSNSKKLPPAAAMIIFACLVIIFTISILYMGGKNSPQAKPAANETAPVAPAENAPANKTQGEVKTLPTSYTDPTYRFTLNFASPYTLTRGSTSAQGVRLDFSLSQWNASVIVGPAQTDTQLIRDSYEIGTEDDITIDGNPAVKIIGTSLKSNEVTYLYLITRGDRVIAVYSTSANIKDVAERMTFSK